VGGGGDEGTWQQKQGSSTHQSVGLGVQKPALAFWHRPDAYRKSLRTYLPACPHSVHALLQVCIHWTHGHCDVKAGWLPYDN
jgi:hypothetical protein